MIVTVMEVLSWSMAVVKICVMVVVDVKIISVVVFVVKLIVSINKERAYLYKMS